MEKLLNLENEKDKLQLVQKKQFLKLRRELLKIASDVPKEIQYFCIEYHSHNEILNEFKQKIDNNKELQNYLKHCEITYLRMLIELECDYEIVIDSIFDVDDIYKNNAKNLVKQTKYDFLGILYKVINYIDDNFPIIKNREFNDEEEKLINFLLFEGNAEKYAKEYNLKQETVNSQIKNICNNYNERSLNTVINLILIEQYNRKTNAEFIKIINF